MSQDKAAIKAQKEEINGHLMYKKLAQRNKENRELLSKIADEELKHYNILKKITKKDIKPNKIKIKLLSILELFFGITFVLKLMEKAENIAQQNYKELEKKYPEIKLLLDDEEKHEDELIKLINEDRLKYVGSIVLGMNDALVELTGTLTGFTFAMQNNKLISLGGLITGIAAALSMAASEYISTKTENNDKNPTLASIYTGIAYLITVILIILPFFFPINPYISLSITLVMGVLIIAIFTYYISVVQDLSFRKRFTNMVFISMGVALLSFFIGLLARSVLGIDI
jgi:VIT1/CCC1 family predicted Fe2+/Mn2+ transporter